MWQPIPGFPYEVSDSGQVRRATTKRLLKPLAGRYLRVDLRNLGQQRRESIHVLVLEAFVGPRPVGMEAAHLDGNAHNNHVYNLAWKTPKENNNDRRIHGTLPIGERHGSSVFTDDQYHDIVTSTRSHRDLAREYGVGFSTIAAIRRRHRLRNGD